MQSGCATGEQAFAEFCDYIKAQEEVAEAEEVAATTIITDAKELAEDASDEKTDDESKSEAEDASSEEDDTVTKKS